MVEKYNHHGRQVSVVSEVKGKHREHCLCHKNCIHFKPDAEREENCQYANMLYAMCCMSGGPLVTPVYECEMYEQED